MGDRHSTDIVNHTNTTASTLYNVLLVEGPNCVEVYRGIRQHE